MLPSGSVGAGSRRKISIESSFSRTRRPTAVHSSSQAEHHPRLDSPRAQWLQQSQTRYVVDSPCFSSCRAFIRWVPVTFLFCWSRVAQPKRRFTLAPQKMLATGLDLSGLFECVIVIRELGLHLYPTDHDLPRPVRYLRPRITRCWWANPAHPQMDRICLHTPPEPHDPRAVRRKGASFATFPTVSASNPCLVVGSSSGATGLVLGHRIALSDPITS